MSLTSQDLASIRSIVKEENEILAGKIEALENDIKEIYTMLSLKYTDSDFDKLPTKEKILELYEKVKFTAKQAGVELPR